MKRIVERSIPNSGISQKTSFDFLRDIVIPVLRETRGIVNSRFGEIAATSVDYTAGDNDEVVIVDSSAAIRNVYLPPLNGYSRTIIIKRIGANNVVVNPNPLDATATIDGAASYTIPASYNSIQLVTTNGHWYSINL